MKRRKFLQMLGMAVSAPVWPSVGGAASYAQSSYELAILHAKKFPLVSVGGLSKRLGIAKPQAEAIIEKLSADGLLGVLNPTRPGTVKAASKIFVNPHAGLAQAYSQRQVRAKVAKEQMQDTAQPANVSALFAHLHRLCRKSGMTLSSRCFSGVHA